MESDDEYDDEPMWKGTPGTIILINIFEKSKYNASSNAQVATCQLIRQYLRSASSHYISVCFYGTEESNTSTFDVIPVLQIFPLSAPSLENYEKLKNTNICNLVEAKEFNLSDVLWHCSKMFNSCKKKLSSRTVVMLTRLDVPPAPSDRDRTLNRAIDLVDSNIDIKIINISETEYAIDKYYEKLLKIANRGNDCIPPQPVWNIKDIEKIVFQETHRNIAIAKLNFEIGDNFNIGVSVYTLLKKAGQNNKKNVDLDRESNAIVTSVTNTLKVSNDVIDEDSQDRSERKVPLLKSELLHYQEFGGERVEFTDEEMKMIKNPFGPPMMKLLGFKPASIICKEKWYFKIGQFLYPNESIVEGSTIAFKALHKACTDMKMVALCILCTRVNSRPVIVALSPCVKPLNLNIDIGFDIVNIPFVEHVRELNVKDDANEDENLVVEIAHKGLMKDIINSTTIDYQPDMFEDPKLQSKYRAIEALALDEDETEPFIDTTKPSIERFQNLPDDLFEELFGPFTSMTLKRSYPKVTSQQTKKPKIENFDEELFNTKLKERKIESYTVAQLKNILKYRNIQNLPALNGLKKAELVNLVYTHCDEEN
ncbi:unnamed protein product [Danaus chrysippus]|uniref:(African queen) hypothetical protein n=1 Tax=Danaus chrysippus TaxID=151541 RepID=A0A8J2W1J2_9NEOP|nr:unnamed protein product [Danaus chrysippus]